MDLIKNYFHQKLLWNFAIVFVTTKVQKRHFLYTYIFFIFLIIREQNLVQENTDKVGIRHMRLQHVLDQEQDQNER